MSRLRNIDVVRWPAWGACVGVCLVALLLATTSKAGAQASPADPNAVVSFEVKATNGYRLAIFGTQRFARVVAWKSHAAAVYATQSASLEHGTFRAHFGSLGEIDVRFRPSAGPSRTKLTCGGSQHASFHFGRFSGRILFRGERRYTQASRRDAQGVLITLDRPCKGSPSGGKVSPMVSSPAFSITSITRERLHFAAGYEAQESIRRFEVRSGVSLGMKHIPPGAVPYAAVVTERRPMLQILRIVTSAGSRDTFAVGSDGQPSFVSPPAPFTGQGRFDPCGARRWTGNLRAAFPGRQSDLLTGHRFFAVLRPLAAC